MTRCRTPAPNWNKQSGCGFIEVMKTDLDVLVFATRLVDELGETAIRISRVRLVELTAANQTRAAAYWRDVMTTAERLLDERSGRRAIPAPIAAPQSTVLHVPRPIP